MKIVGTIVNKEINLIGLLLKGKPVEFHNNSKSDYIMQPFKLSEVKKLIKEGKIKDYTIDDKDNIIGVKSKKLSDLPMYDSKGNFIDKQIEIHSIIADKDCILGAVILFKATGEEKKVKLEDLFTVYNYCEPTNFMLRNRDNNFYITGKGETKKEDIPVLDISKKFDKDDLKDWSVLLKEPVGNKKSCIKEIDFTPEVEKYLGMDVYKSLVIPERVQINGEDCVIVGYARPIIIDYGYREIAKLKLPSTLRYFNDRGRIWYVDIKGSLVIPKSVEEIPSETFVGCFADEVIVEKGNPYFFVKDGCLYDKRDKRLLACFENGKHHIFKGTEIIDYGAFWHKDLEIYMPKSIKRIKSLNFGHHEDFRNWEIVIYYEGTIKDFSKIELDGPKMGEDWFYNCSDFYWCNSNMVIHSSDGTIYIQHNKEFRQFEWSFKDKKGNTITLEDIID